jgi:hypothetical protein
VVAKAEPFQSPQGAERLKPKRPLSPFGFVSISCGSDKICKEGGFSGIVKPCLLSPLRERSATVVSLSRIGGLRCWPNDSIRPVLKHGPRSLTYVRVCS